MIRLLRVPTTTLRAINDMNPSYCVQCNGLNPDLSERSPTSTSVTLLQDAVREGCRSCQVILEGIRTFITPSEDFEVELNWNDDGQGTLKVLIWAGLRMTRNPKRSKVANAVAPLRLEFFTPPNQPSPWPVFGARPEISIDSESENCFQRIEDWIRNCMKGHADCHQPSYTALPSRLVDVGSADSQKLKLVETRGIEGTYFTLSHCWGGNQPLKTTKATLRERMGGIKWESLPKTFQDAVTITRKLRMQYIWIDSLCIVQDDADDWETEAANMGAIYEASLLTISASIASNPNHGIFSHRLQPNKICGVDNNGNEYSVFVRKMVSHTHLSTEAAKGPKSDIPLLTRAWAYQERLLATRVLHYLPDELFWECRSAIRCECGVYIPGAKLRHHSKRGFSKVIQRNQAEPSRLAIEPWRWTVIELKMWPQIVAEYSARDLTFRKDRLPALSGVARQLHTSNPSMQYLAGLWLDHLPEALLWRVLKKRPQENQLTRTREGPLGSRDSQPGAQTPSWSWTSLEGDRISISYPERKLVDEKVKIINAQTIPSGIDPFSSVKQGTIRLRGPVVGAVLSYSGGRSDESTTIKYVLTCGGISRPFIPDTSLSNENDFDFLRSGATVYCLLVGTFAHGDVQALVLRQSRMFADMYKRLGLLTFFDKVKTNTLANSWFEKTKYIEIVLI
ncbi:heterokaryon incompatibility protein-domain-containing protein [Leptodontidium sp. MPI-SDFR-AT-0119]|nr:heterokaryon incompatibility protein-domain-containing protein [Leptodontidium sp. MPI-SDFR-AT-0119]